MFCIRIGGRRPSAANPLRTVSMRIDPLGVDRSRCSLNQIDCGLCISGTICVLIPEAPNQGDGLGVDVGGFNASGFFSAGKLVMGTDGFIALGGPDWPRGCVWIPPRYLHGCLATVRIGDLLFRKALPLWWTWTAGTLGLRSMGGALNSSFSPSLLELLQHPPSYADSCAGEHRRSRFFSGCGFS